MIRHYSPTDHRRSIPLFRWKSSMFLPQIQGARARGRHDGRAVDPTDRRTIFVFFCGCWSRWSRWILGFVQGFRLMRCYLSWIWILGAIETLNGKKPKNNLRDIYIYIYIYIHVVSCDIRSFSLANDTINGEFVQNHQLKKEGVFCHESYRPVIFAIWLYNVINHWDRIQISLYWCFL